MWVYEPSEKESSSDCTERMDSESALLLRWMELMARVRHVLIEATLQLCLSPGGRGRYTSVSSPGEHENSFAVSSPRKPRPLSAIAI
jgi:hypothetical protein